MPYCVVNSNRFRIADSSCGLLVLSQHHVRLLTVHEAENEVLTQAQLPFGAPPAACVPVADNVHCAVDASGAIALVRISWGSDGRPHCVVHGVSVLHGPESIVSTSEACIWPPSTTAGGVVETAVHCCGSQQERGTSADTLAAASGAHTSLGHVVCAAALPCSKSGSAGPFAALLVLGCTAGASHVVGIPQLALDALQDTGGTHAMCALPSLPW
jgi:hypothetical protein